MLLWNRTMVCSHRRLVQTTVVSGTVWPQLFAMKFLTGGCEFPVWGKGWSWDGGGPLRLSSQVMTSYRLPVVT